MEGLGLDFVRVLHAGCGGNAFPALLSQDEPIEETRLDIDESVNPDIVASLDALGDIGPFEAVYCSHALEHLDCHAAQRALGEFHRVLEPGGLAIVLVPDLEGIKPTNEVVYSVNGQDITGLDMIYGHRDRTPGNPYMRHQCGFVAETLEDAMKAAGFAWVVVKSAQWSLYAIGIKQ